MPAAKYRRPEHVKVNRKQFNIDGGNVLTALEGLSYRQLRRVAEVTGVPAWSVVRSIPVWLEPPVLASKIAHDCLKEGHTSTSWKYLEAITRGAAVREADVPRNELPGSLAAVAARQEVPAAPAREVVVEERVIEKTVEVEKIEVRGFEVRKGERVVHSGEAALPEEFQDILTLAAARKNILLVGPSGCGKTFLAEQVAKSLELPFSSISCSVGLSEAKVSGWLLPIEDGGKFAYVPAGFIELYENGGVFLFDELDAADANMLVFLNQALANEGFALPQRHDNPWVVKHADFVCIAAANTFGHGADMIYAGRNQLDGATLDRFGVGKIFMDYDREVERNLTGNNTELLDWGWKVRQEIQDKRLRRIMSTRFLRDAADMMANGWDLKRVRKAYFADWSRDERAKVGEVGSGK